MWVPTREQLIKQVLGGRKLMDIMEIVMKSGLLARSPC